MFPDLHDPEADDFLKLQVLPVRRYISGNIFIKIQSVVLSVKLLTDRQTNRQTPVITLPFGGDNSNSNTMITEWNVVAAIYIV